MKSKDIIHMGVDLKNNILFFQSVHSKNCVMGRIIDDFGTKNKKRKVRNLIIRLTVVS